MAEVRLWNPHDAKNPKRKKALTREQVEKRQAKAVRFLRDVADDSDLADEIEDLSVQEYAERKGFQINLTKNKKGTTPMKRDELQQVVKDAVSEAIKQTRRLNPNGQQAAPTFGTGNGKKAQFSDRKEILDAVDDAAAALADGDDDEALDILNGLLDRAADES